MLMILRAPLNEVALRTLRLGLDEICNYTNLPAAIRKYLQASDFQLPRFHVIPKVHKDPWSSRPIVPSHSWVTSRVSEVVDYCLKPLMKDYPTILDSTKSFIQRVRRLQSVSGCWIVTGDVTAMYTNIKLQPAIDAVSSMLSKEGSKRVRKAAIIGMMEFVMMNSYFQFQDKVYQQKSGLAMGTACAPTIANLYCAAHEKLSLKFHPKVKSYGRYIDDIFFIYKGTEDELRKFTTKWQLPGLSIVWEWSKTKAHFLDVELEIMGDGRLATRLYEKTLNKHLYIPFSSAHPLSVKRAFVKAERGRYHQICSDPNDALKSEQNLYRNLLKRGYPHRLLGQWFKDSIESFQRPPPTFLLPSQYNPIWECIRMEPIRKILSEYGTDDFLKEVPSIVTSLRKGSSMYDIYNSSNLAILNDLLSTENDDEDLEGSDES